MPNQPPLNQAALASVARAQFEADRSESPKPEVWGEWEDQDTAQQGLYRSEVAETVQAYLAAVPSEVTSVEATPGEKLAAQIILRVDVMLGVDPGTNTPNAFEPPYEYLVIRGAEALKAEAIIQSGIFQVVGEGVFDDADPDSVLVEAVTHGLSSLAAASQEVKP